MLEARGTDECSILYIKFQKFSSMTLQALMTFDKDTMNDTLVLADELLSICSSLGAQVNLLSDPARFWTNAKDRLRMSKRNKEGLCS